jgi:hypothetical protein
MLELPCNASLNDVLTLLESYTTNMSNELSSMTSVVVAEGNCIDLVAGTYSIQQVYEAINDAICALKEGGTCDCPCPMIVSINGVTNNVLSCSVTGGVAPYSYQWVMQDNVNSIELTGSTTSTTATIVPGLFGVTYGYVGLVKLTITDADGCKASDTFWAKWMDI